MAVLYSHIFSYACFADLHQLHIIALQGAQKLRLSWICMPCESFLRGSDCSEYWGV